MEIVDQTPATITTTYDKDGKVTDIQTSPGTITIRTSNDEEGWQHAINFGKKFTAEEKFSDRLAREIREKRQARKGR